MCGIAGFVGVKNCLYSLVEEFLAPEKINEDGIFHLKNVNLLKKEHFAMRANHSHILWALIIFQDWKKRWKVTI